ncbi:MAG: AAA family ATPase [Gemmatimonadota bacterium]
MAAEIIAATQGFDLFKVDLAALISKFIGETEKNLEQVFQDAESSHAILFFDEADAVFGKRSEVRDAHDQYANQQVNYLLQRVEAYDGVIILATNMRQNMDEAFLRRLSVVVELPFPDDEARADIWRRIWPAGIQVDPTIDFADLARRFRVAGGSIRNAAIDSAYRAVARATSQGPIYIERSDIILAIGREYQKLGRPVTRAEFRDDYPLVIDALFAPPPEAALA